MQIAPSVGRRGLLRSGSGRLSLVRGTVDHRKFIKEFNFLRWVRLLTEALLCTGKSQYYRYGIGDLREAVLLAECVDDWKGIEPHELFMERLRAEHGRKWSFWKQW